ncbi:hypothetical protein HDV63DRAFT_292425 [Trichoderma sp. SZMC 28014]
MVAIRFILQLFTPPSVMSFRRDLHHGEKHHAGDTDQGDLAGLESNTGAVGATGGRGDRSTGRGNDCGLEGSRADAGADSSANGLVGGRGSSGGGVVRGGNGDGVKSGESDSLCQDGGRRLSGGGLRESKGRESGGGEQRELHLEFVEWFFWWLR